ncbi:MAG: GNAT family N-acetyltransferase [Thermodesulfobacteriota bacterium]
MPAPANIAAALERGGLKKLTVSDRLGLIGLIDENLRLASSQGSSVADLFGNLWDLVAATVSGSKIDRLKPEHTPNGFRVWAINAETGENLGRLHMLYLNKPIPCYYLVYVEVAPPYRRKGLGHRILTHFREFLIEKSAIGLLDNIIPEDDPTFDIYLKQCWQPLTDFIGRESPDLDGYMIYVPPRFQDRDLSLAALKLVHHLKRRRAAIDMRDNELMVRQTIAEFKDLYAALVAYFDEQLRTGRSTTLMRFMFTRYVTKLIAFRRRISELLGYTGGESLEQIVLTDEVSHLPIQSYPPSALSDRPTVVFADERLAKLLPDDLKTDPSATIERLPNYRRPSLTAWLALRGRDENTPLTIGDLMELGFDPTRLKEIVIEGETFIFERLQARQLTDLNGKKELLERVAREMPGLRTGQTMIRVNPPLLAISHRGSLFVLRRKVEGIHWDEAVEQLQTEPGLKSFNSYLKVDRLIRSAVRQTGETIGRELGVSDRQTRELLTFFISWDLRANRPLLIVDLAGSSLETLWLA